MPTDPAFTGPASTDPADLPETTESVDGPGSNAEFGDTGFVDSGLLSPVTVGADIGLDDGTFAACLIEAELALTRAWVEVGVAPEEAAESIEKALGLFSSDVSADADFVQDPPEHPAEMLELGALIEASVAGGNPVIPLVGMLRDLVPEPARTWVHRGATSQDIMDTALMMMASGAGLELLTRLYEVEETLVDFAAVHRDRVAAARTLTQHAVPTTVGLRAANWARSVRRAADRVEAALGHLPAQLGGAGGTLASFVLIGGADAAAELPAAFAEELGLAVPDAPWHTTRWPVTELGDAVVQAVDALGVIAADVATLSRTEIGELAEGAGGGSSAMPQKHNPARAVLIRSAALRAPQLGATLHTAAGLAVDERPDGAWHAEWPTLRELLRLGLGAAQNAHIMVAGLNVNQEAVARNLGMTGGLIVAERLSIELGPIIGAVGVKRLIAAAGGGEDLAELLEADPQISAAGIDVGALLDPALYTGLAGPLVDLLLWDDEADIDSDTDIDIAAEETN